MITFKPLSIVDHLTIESTQSLTNNTEVFIRARTTHSLEMQ